MYKILSLILLFSAPALAEISSTFDFNMGFTSVLVSTNVSKTRVDSLMTLDLNYNLNVTVCHCSLSIGFQEMPTSTQGMMNFTRVGVGGRYYPFGENGMRVILDSKVEGRVWAPAPFVGVDIGMANISVAKADETGRYFNMVANDIAIRFGNEIPIRSDVIIMGHLLYYTSLSSASQSESTASSYNGYGVYVGVRLTSFD